MRRRGKRASPMRTYALLRAIVEDDRFSKLGSSAQAALLASVIKYADHDGWWFAKQVTIGRVVGRSDRRVRDALVACGELLRIKGSRRPDGTQGANEYQLSKAVREQADEYVLLWNSKTKTSGGDASETSGGTSPDGSDRLPSPDGNVRPRTALDRTLNGLAKEQPSEMSDEDFEVWVTKVGTSEFGRSLIDTARLARGEVTDA